MASKPPLLLRQAAPRLSRHFFAPKPCLGQFRAYQLLRPQLVSQSQHKAARQTPFLQAFRSESTASGGALNASPLQNLSRTFGERPAEACVQKEHQGFFPKQSSNAVGYWLLASAASVFGIVVFGGLTRLTESGLSITEWRPVTGTLPPLDPESWTQEFAKYRRSPEFQLLNPRMDLDEFKTIYWMEYTHRLWGRLVGLTFVIPAVYFIARRRITARVATNLLGISTLIGLQGFIGWWMVASGLKDDLFAKGSHPRVSQYRLATHLSIAFAVYTSMLWNGLTILQSNTLSALQPRALNQHMAQLSHPALRRFRLAVPALAALVATTAFSGALVAGLDAGLIYNEFPYMGLGLAPPKSELFSAFYSREPAPHNDLIWRNVFENPSLVQLDHRILATTTFTAVHALWAYSLFSRTLRPLMPLGIRRRILAVVALTWCQVVLGISTLIYMVPLPLASMHQAGSLALLTGVVVLGRRVWVPRALKKMAKSLPVAGGASLRVGRGAAITSTGVS